MTMATKPTPRASVRLRIENGTALITNLGGDPISCDLAEISLSGCKCRIPRASTTEDVIAAWKLILVPSRVLSLKFSAPAEFSGMIVPSAEVRWVSDDNPEAIFFGVSFGGLSSEQSLALSMNLMSLASKKLRGKTTEVPAAVTAEPSGVPPEPIPSPAAISAPAPLPDEPVPVEAVAAAPEPAPPPARSSGSALPATPAKSPGSALPRVATKSALSTPSSRAKSSATMPAVSASQFSTGRKRLPGRSAPRFGTKAPAAPPPEEPPARKPNDWSDFDRQVLIAGGFHVTFHFIDAAGKRLEETEHAGRVTQFSETEFQIEAGAPGFCQAPDLAGHAHLLVKVVAPEAEFLAQLAIRTVKPVDDGNRWQFSTRIAAMGDGDRLCLRELYARTSRPVSTRSKQIRELTTAEVELANLREHAAKTASALNEMRRNLEAARQAQTRMLPERPPAVDGYDMAVLYESCVELSGDLYHFIDAGPGLTGLLIGDVSGHGVEAAMVMSATLKSFAVRGKGEASPAVVLSAVNEDLHNDLRRGMFVTAFYAILDHQTGRLTYGRAGHNPALLISPRIGLRPLEGNGLALGIAARSKFDMVIREHTVEIQSDALLVMYTDGIVEAMNARKEEFGEGQLCELLWQNSALPCTSIIQTIQAAVRSHTAGHPIADDQTLVLLKKS